MTLSPNIPLFSVLIANYNNGQYMQQAIDSVMAQTYDNWEIVIVDDGSTDNSSEIYKNTNPIPASTYTSTTEITVVVTPNAVAQNWPMEKSAVFLTQMTS